MEKYIVSGAKNGYDESGAHNGTKGIHKLPQVVAAPDGGTDDDLEFMLDNFSNDEWDEIKKQFNDFDLDGNGYIEVEEFVALCEHVGMSRERAVKLSMLYDEDGDGVIDFAEFSKRDVVSDLQQAVEGNTLFEDAEIGVDDGAADQMSHVNVAKILQVVRAKIDNSKIAFRFGRYALFVSMYVYVVLGQRQPSDSNSLTNGLRNYFVRSKYLTPNGQDLKGFMDINSVDDIWDWTTVHFANNLFYVPNYYNGGERNRIDSNTVLEHNKLTGGFRITQRRIEKESCLEGKATFKKFAPRCYGELYVDAMVPTNLVEKRPFYGEVTGTEYRWESKWIWDVGYYERFDSNKEKTMARLEQLRLDLWIGPPTQWVRLDFAVYNPNVGMFAFCVATFEIRPTGLIVPQFEITTRRSGYYQSTSDWSRCALEIFVVLGWSMYCYGEVLDARKLYKESGKMLEYFSEFWNVVDIMHLMVTLMLILNWFYILADGTVGTLIISEDTITMADGSPVDFTATSMAVRFYFAAHGFNMLLFVIRILKFLRQNAYLGQLTDALELMRPGLVQFAVVLFISIFMFTAIGVILFGSKVKAFTSFLEACDMILGYTVGFGNPMELFQSDATGASVFYYPFTFLMAFFVLPLTIAVIMDGYGEMQAMYEAARTSNLEDLINLSYLDQLYRGLIRSCQYFIRNHHQHERLRLPAKEEILRLFSDLNDLNIVPYKELRKLFSDKFISEELLVEIIKKYNAFQQDPSLTSGLQQHARTDKAEFDVAPLITQLQLRADQLVRDQQTMQRKLDLLCEIFPMPAHMEH